MMGMIRANDRIFVNWMRRDMESGREGRERELRREDMSGSGIMRKSS